MADIVGVSPNSSYETFIDINENESDVVASVKQTWACDPVDDPCK